MVIESRPADETATGDWSARFEFRSLEDIRALGRDTSEYLCAFAEALKDRLCSL